MLTKAPKGTMDILPQNSYKWQYIEEEIRKICKEFGVKEIRTPVFEHTELFQRGVGDTTDVVEKEMYTFNDKGDRSITLRPEGTAGAVRSFIEHGMFNDPQPTKMYYLISCYRYEKPQAGRYREFHQFGVEYFGTQSPATDAEMISLPWMLYKRLGLKNLTLNINSIGCPKCRKEYNEKLRDYLKSRYDDLCETCKNRYDRNPMRILDCKSSVCKGIVKDAPLLIDCICDECKDHFEAVKKYLTCMDIPFSIDPLIVRGLDYYTKTVFEITAKNENSNGTICGGGRYDGLVEELGGGYVPACGFALGMERLLLTMEEQGIEIENKQKLQLYVGHIGDENSFYAQKLVSELRELGICVDRDHLGRSVKAQMKYANKLGVKYSLILGDDEIAQKRAKLKNMDEGIETEIELSAKTIAENII
ncbi:MAG: histidine--tRNA ligase [Ruminococcaceae bacterium]|nr:histidine--tRNA ligase [Oscillospiraceae bacterium]